MKYTVEYVTFRKVEIEAESRKEAMEMAQAMEDEEIERRSTSKGYEIWNLEQACGGRS